MLLFVTRFNIIHYLADLGGIFGVTNVSDINSFFLRGLASCLVVLLASLSRRNITFLSIPKSQCLSTTIRFTRIQSIPNIASAHCCARLSLSCSCLLSHHAAFSFNNMTRCSFLTICLFVYLPKITQTS